MMVLSAAAVMAMVLAVMAAPAMAKEKTSCPEGSTPFTENGETFCEVPKQVDENGGISCPPGSINTNPGSGMFSCLVDPVSKKEAKDKK